MEGLNAMLIDVREHQKSSLLCYDSPQFLLTRPSILEPVDFFHGSPFTLRIQRMNLCSIADLCAECKEAFRNIVGLVIVQRTCTNAFVQGSFQVP